MSKVTRSIVLQSTHFAAPQKTGVSRLVDILALTCLGIIGLLPFHALLTTWAGSTLGHIDLWRIWKEILIFIAVWPTLFIALRTPRLRSWLAVDWLPRAMLAYVALYVALGLWGYSRGNTDGDALVYALFSDLRYVVFFLMTAVIATLSPLLDRYALRVALGSAIGVVSFGVLQTFVLPYDALKHLGYGPDTIPAYQTVDNKIEYQRIQSTLRGANPLGAYLVVILSLLATLPRRLLHKWYYWLLLAGSMSCLFYSYSRSGYIGAIAAVGIIVFAQAAPRWRKRILLASVVAITIGMAGLYMLRDNAIVQNTLFHSDETSQSSQSSNTGRAQALEGGVSDVASDPIGDGPGTAGPASMRNDKATPRIAESYFIQLGQEIGWLGVALFVAVNVLLGRVLWKRRQSRLALALFGSLCGLTLVNIVSHAWADDTLGLLWWGLAGIAAKPGIIAKDNHKKYEKSTHHKKTKASSQGS